MSSIERIAKDGTRTEVLAGSICRCTPDDRPALFDLYRASYPEVLFKDFDLSDADLPFWYAFKDERGEMRLAMFVWSNGVVFVIAAPEDAESPEVRTGFLRLAREIREALGVPSLCVFHSSQLHRFGEVLEREGFLSKETLVSRVMHFDPTGDVLRVS